MLFTRHFQGCFMPIKSRLLSQEEQHICNYSDAVLVRSIGVSWALLSRVLGYSQPSSLSRKINRYRKGDQPLPIQLSCLIEVGLWRLGCMNTFITLKRAQKGSNAIAWHRLPTSLN